MTTADFITELFCKVDDKIPENKHSQAVLHPSEVVTLALLYALKGSGQRAFWRWLTRDCRGLYSAPVLIELFLCSCIFSVVSYCSAAIEQETGMIRISFTESDIEQLRYERFHHPHPRVQRKAEAVLLKSAGMRHEDICGITGICGNTPRNYLRDYAEGGIERLKEVNFYRPGSELERHRESIKDYFREHPPADMKEAVSVVEQLTGIRRSENRVREYLEKIGMKRRKVGMIPAKADPEKQERFVKEELNPRLKEAEQGRRAVFLSMRRTSC